jgi:hypothetical protein
VLVIVSVVVLALYQAPKLSNSAQNLTSESFGDNEYHKDYAYYFDRSKGQVSLEDNRLLVFGTVSIINTDVSYQNPEFAFDVLVVKGGPVAFVEIIFRDVDVTTETSFNFTIKHHHIWQRVKFGVDNQSQVWVEIDGEEPKSLEMSSTVFNANVPYNVIVKITGDTMENRCSVNIDNVCLGA